MTKIDSLKRYPVQLWNIVFGVALLCCYVKAMYAEEIEFNTSIVDIQDKENIDFSRFSRAGYIMPGNYTLTLRVNDSEMSELPIDWFTADDDENESKPCLTAKLVEVIGLKPALKPDLTWWHQGECLNLDSLPGATVRGDLGANALYLNVPQIYMEYRAPNWDPPSLWDEGVSGVLFDYYASAQSRRENDSGTVNTVTGNGVVGVNTGPWRLRANWQGSYNNGTERRRLDWEWTRFYAWRALPKINAKLGLGENSLYSDIFDSFSYTGVNLATDDSMLPPNLRGYAPEISGVARTNAKVIVSQQGRVIQETRVAAGPFRIQDLSEMISGELDVRVEEQDGSVQTFRVNTASVPYLTRPGQLRYKLVAGRPSDFRHHLEGPAFTTGEFSWGVSNGWSLYGGAIGSENYNSLAMGIGRDLMAFGALSFDVTQAWARRLPFEDTGSQSGASWRLSYAKRFDETDSEINFAGYRYSEQGYMSMGDYLNARKYGENYGNGKEMYTATFNQRLRDWRMSVYLNYSHQSYWDRPDNDRFTLTAAKYFNFLGLRNISLSATAYRNKYSNSRDDGFYLSFSLPWGNSGTLSYNGAFNHNDSTHQASYFNSLDDRSNYQVSGGMSRNGATGSGNYNYLGDIAQLHFNAAYQSNRYSTMSVSAQGGATATAQGAALHRISMMGGTRMMIDTAGVSGVPVKTWGANTRTNRFGLAVVGDVSSYYRNRVSIDINGLPDNAEATGSVMQRTLTEGAIGYGKFDVISGAKAMAMLRLETGDIPPFGAVVENSQRQHVGVVGDDGSVYLSGMQPGEKMRVFWNGKAQCELELPKKLPADFMQNLFLPCRALAIISSSQSEEAIKNQ